MSDITIGNILQLATYQELAKNKAPVTEDAAALAFADRYRHQLRFDHHLGKWFVWDGARWRCEDTRLAFCWARDLVRELTKSAPAKARMISSKVSFAAGAERFAQADRAFAVTSDIWDRDAYLLGTPAGTIDLRTGVLMEAQPDHYITKTTAVAPAETADCPRLLQFLQEATNGDQALIDFLQQFCGYALTGEIKEHALLFIYGDGGNGKSVFQNTIASILLDYCVTAAMETFVASNNDRHPTDLAMLRGARLVMASETEEGRTWAESKIKIMTGGDRIRARFMRQDFFEYLPQFKLLIIGNHQPSLHNVDDAAKRRFNIIPFIHKPATPDLDLEKKLSAEWPGILRWMIDGCLAWQRAGLVRPQVVIEATAEYFEDQNTIQHWIEEKCNTGKGGLTCSSTDLFKSWSAWANAHGEPPGSAKRFVGVLKRLRYRYKRTDRWRGFFGIELKPETVRWSGED